MPLNRSRSDDSARHPVERIEQEVQQRIKKVSDVWEAVGHAAWVRFGKPFIILQEQLISRTVADSTYLQKLSSKNRSELLRWKSLHLAHSISTVIITEHLRTCRACFIRAHGIVTKLSRLYAFAPLADAFSNYENAANRKERKAGRYRVAFVETEPFIAALTSIATNDIPPGPASDLLDRVERLMILPWNDAAQLDWIALKAEFYLDRNFNLVSLVAADIPECVQILQALAANRASDLQKVEELRLAEEDRRKAIRLHESGEGNGALFETSTRTSATDGSVTRNVFVITGSDDSSVAAVDALLRRIKCTPLILQRLNHPGKTRIEVLEEHLRDADAVIALFKPEDEGRRYGSNGNMEPRVPQDVLIETGYAVISNRLRSVIVALEGVVVPSDFDGICVIQGQGWDRAMELAIAIELNRILRLELSLEQL